MSLNELLENEDHWVTNIGASFPGERVVFRGQDLFTELDNEPWMGLLLFGITGRKFNADQIRLFEAIWSLTVSYPDVRLWNNRVAALAGSVRSSAALAISSAIAVSEAKIYGGQANVAAIDFIIETQRQVEKGADLEYLLKNELKQRRVVSGYGRPIVKHDERIEPLMKIVRQLGFADGVHLKLAFEIEEILLSGRWRMRMNASGLGAALGADQGLSVREYYHWLVLCFSAGILPCFIDTLNNKEGVFFPLRCERISYQGIPARRWSST